MRKMRNTNIEIGIPMYKGPFIRPFHVLWSPNNLFPSFKIFPPSIGFPPPVITILALLIYAGTMNKRLKISIPIQSAQDPIAREITRKCTKIKHAKKIAKRMEIFLYFCSISVSSLLLGMMGVLTQFKCCNKISIYIKKKYI